MQQPADVKAEHDEVEYLYACKMAELGPFRISRTLGACPTFNKTGHWS